MRLKKLIGEKFGAELQIVNGEPMGVFTCAICRDKFLSNLDDVSDLVESDKFHTWVDLHRKCELASIYV